jgi:hypothetical protein
MLKLSKPTLKLILEELDNGQYFSFKPKAIKVRRI